MSSEFIQIINTLAKGQSYLQRYKINKHGYISYVVGKSIRETQIWSQ